MATKRKANHKFRAAFMLTKIIRQKDERCTIFKILIPHKNCVVYIMWP